jgi:hypothetical protein
MQDVACVDTPSKLASLLNLWATANGGSTGEARGCGRGTGFCSAGAPAMSGMWMCAVVPGRAPAPATCISLPPTASASGAQDLAYPPIFRPVPVGPGGGDGALCARQAPAAAAAAGTHRPQHLYGHAATLAAATRYSPARSGARGGASTMPPPCDAGSGTAAGPGCGPGWGWRPGQRLQALLWREQPGVGA